MSAPVPNAMTRYVDSYLSSQGDAIESFGRLSSSQADYAPSLTVNVKVVVYDGDREIVPIAQVGSVRREVLIYDTDEIRKRRNTAPPTGQSPAKQAAAALHSASRRLLQSVAAPSLHSLEDYVLHSKLFDQTLAKCTHRDDEELGGQPAFFLMGRQISRDGPFARSPQTIGGVLRALGNSVEWSEVTLDLALNEAAKQNLRTKHYTRSSSISVRIEGVELAWPASDDSPFGLPPSTYVSVQHGTVTRYSHIERNSLTPVFQWTTGGIPYTPHESIKVCVHMASAHEGRPRKDRIVGQMWLDAPVLPLPNAMLYPELMSMSLGASVGIIHLSIKGPALRQKSVPGCVCYCCCCTIPICGTPPCLPSIGTCSARCAAGCLRALRSERCETFTKYACCCCIALGLTFLIAKAPQMQEAAVGASRHAADLQGSLTSLGGVVRVTSAMM